MPVNVRLGASRTRCLPSAGVYELAVPLLAGCGLEPLWRGQLRPEGVADDALWYGVDSDAACLALSVPVGNDMAEVTRTAYLRLFRALGERRCLRIWNFVPAINDEGDGLERYRAFSLGRHEAFATHYGEQAQAAYCSASALGTSEPRLSILALATTPPVVNLENPAQCPAYAYPDKFGPRPPSFTRASALAGAETALFISGTSAVIGAESVAAGDLAGQLAATGENLDVMIAQAQERLGWGRFSGLGAPIARVYLRHPEYTPVAQAWLAKQAWYHPDRYSVVQADICRRELLVEIELSWPSVLADVASAGKLESHGCEPL